MSRGLFLLDNEILEHLKNYLSDFNYTFDGNIRIPSLSRSRAHHVHSFVNTDANQDNGKIFNRIYVCLFPQSFSQNDFDYPFLLLEKIDIKPNECGVLIFKDEIKPEQARMIVIELKNKWIPLSFEEFKTELIDDPGPELFEKIESIGDRLEVLESQKNELMRLFYAPIQNIDSDNIIKLFLEESIQAFVNKNLLSSGAMLGVVFELIIKKLITKLAECYSNDTTVNATLLKATTASHRLDLFENHYSAFVNSKNSDIRQNFVEIWRNVIHEWRQTITILFQSIRMYRNIIDHALWPSAEVEQIEGFIDMIISTLSPHFKIIGDIYLVLEHYS